MGCTIIKTKKIRVSTKSTRAGESDQAFIKEFEAGYLMWKKGYDKFDEEKKAKIVTDFN